MKNASRIAIVALLALAIGAVLVLKGGRRAGEAPAPTAVAPAIAPSAAPGAAATEATPLGRPRLLELGSKRCQSCQEMLKVLEALRASQGAKLQVDFIDVFDQPEAADRHAIKLIPTQIFFDAGGREVYRHTGFISHDDVLAAFRARGVGI